MMNNKNATLLTFLLSSVAMASPVQVGSSQAWVDLPDFQALASTGTAADILDAFEDSLHSVNTNAQNPNGLTLESALNVLGEFNAGVGPGIGDPSLPCDDVVARFYQYIPTLDLPSVEVLNTILDEEDCDAIKNVIDEYLDDIQDSDLFQDCIHYDAAGDCDLWLQNYPCETWQDCECVMENAAGDCIAWANTGPLIGPPGSGGEDDGYDLDGNDDDDVIGNNPGTDTDTDTDEETEDETEDGGNGPTAGVTSTNGSCTGANSGDQTAPHGPNQTTSNPVLRSPGYKYEKDTDISVELPGRDFVLSRTYNASPGSASRQTPWMIGGGWGTTVDGWIKYTPNGTSVNEGGNFVLNSLPSHLSVTLMPIQSGKKFYDPNETGTLFIPGVGLGGGPYKSKVTLNSGVPSYWVLQGEGAGATYFLKEGPSDGSQDHMVGRIIKQIDSKGSEWNFTYTSLTDPSGDAARARLSQIFLNGSSFGNSDAVVDFQWDFGTISNPGTGLLKSISVKRPHVQPNGFARAVTTQYVNYTYDIDDLQYDHLNDGTAFSRLILVERGSLVNAPMYGELVDANAVQSFEYHKQFTHFRYKQSIKVQETGLFGLDNSHFAGLMTHRFEPEQMEFYAESYLKLHPAETLDDAIEAMLHANLNDDVPGTLNGNLTVSNLASKIVSYYGLGDSGDQGSGYGEGELAFRVRSQVLQAACGCGGGSVSTKAESFKYARRAIVDREAELQFTYLGATATIGFQAARESSVTILTEGIPFIDPNDPNDVIEQISRKTFTWSEEQTIYEADPIAGAGGGNSVFFDYKTVRSPFTIGNHIVDTYTDGTERQWTSFHDFDPNNLTRTRRYHPSAVESVAMDSSSRLLYPNASGIENRSSVDAKGAFSLREDDGFVEYWTYNNKGNIQNYSVQHGANGLPILKYTKEYSPVVGRSDLVTNKKYFAEDGSTVLQEIDYSYDLFTQGLIGTAQIVTKKTTSIDTELVSENGPGNESQVIVEHFSPSTGRATRVEHADGTETLYSYSRLGEESHTQNWLTMTRESADQNDLDLVSERYFDALGRLRAMKSPTGVLAYTEFGLEQVEMYSGSPGNAVMEPMSKLEYLTVSTYPHDMGAGESPRFTGAASRSWVTAGMNLLREDQYEVLDLQVDSNSMAVTHSILNSVPSSKTIYRYTPSGAHFETRVWHDISNLDVDEASYLTRYDYDVLGRLNQMIDHSGTVTETQYDADNRTLKLWVYSEGATPVLRSEYFYDHDYSVSGDPVAGLGDGNLTLERMYVSSTTGEYRDSVYIFDWQNRKRMSFMADNFSVLPLPHMTSVSGSASISVFDNMNRPVAVASLKGVDHSFLIEEAKNDTIEVSDIFSADTSSVQRVHFGRRGLPFATETAINPADEIAGYLRTNTWYDSSGKTLTTVAPNGSVAKIQYDGFGRAKRTISVDGQGARGQSSYNLAVSLLDADNIVLEESEIMFDDLGRVEMTVSLTRNHLAQEPNVAPATGIGTNPIATYSMPMYDAASRPIASVSFGTNTQADVFQSGGAPPTITVNDTPALLRARPDLIVTETIYDEIGRASIAIDPLGRKHKALFNDLGRTYATIENFNDNGLVVEWDNTAGHYKVTARNSNDGVDQNRVTSSVFDFAGNTVKQVAHLRKGNDEVVQVTTYEYDPSNALEPHNEADLYGNLYEIRYPIPGDGTYVNSDGQSGTLEEDTVQFGYNYLGEQVASRDQNGTIRTFTRDGLGRLTQEDVVAFGTDVDASIDVLKTSYDNQGRVELSQSLNSNDLLSPFNEVVYHYNPRGDLIKLDQLSKAGTALRSLEWSYITSPNGSGTNEHRLEWMQYPDGSKFVPTYGDADLINPLDSRIDRVRGFELRESDYATAGDEIPLVSYEHLGLGTIVKIDFGGYQTDRSVDDELGTRGQAGVYPGWDRFGRLKRHTTVNTIWSGNTQGQLFSESFSYDQLSNRLNKVDNRLGAIENNRDFAYGYDELNRLIDTNRGIHTDVDSTNDELEGSRSWALDELGNWNDVVTQYDDAGSTLTETRKHNGTNELYEMGSDDLEYDHNGNLTLFGGRDFVYDAWNRLVRVTQGTSTIAEYDYNALHWRVAKRAKDSTGTDTQRLMYYSPSWQLVYEDIDTSYVSSSGHTSSSFASTFYGKRGIDDVLYRAIDDDDGLADGIYERGFAYLTDNQFSVIGLVQPSYGQVYERIRYDSYGKPTHSFPEDVTGDGSINYYDVSAVSNTYYPNQDPIADFNFDGSVNYFDISAVSSASSSKSLVGLGWITDDGANGPRNSLGFMGYQWEPEVGLWLGRNRMYSPDAGRWLQRDPAGYVDGLSMYLFVRGNPLSYIDPMGLCATNQDGPQWHHLIPQQMRELMEELGINIDDKKLGWLLRQGDHAELENLGWGQDWIFWSESFGKKGFTAEDVVEQLNVMMDKDGKYASILNKGAPALHRYGNWKGKANKETFFRTARARKKRWENQVLKLAKKSKSFSKAKWLAKRSGALAILVAGGELLAGEDPMRVALSTAQPVPLESMEAIVDESKEGVDALYDRGQSKGRDRRRNSSTRGDPAMEELYRLLEP